MREHGRKRKGAEGRGRPDRALNATETDEAVEYAENKDFKACSNRCVYFC
jgi:hypothetical protein